MVGKLDKVAEAAGGRALRVVVCDARISARLVVALCAVHRGSAAATVAYEGWPSRMPGH